MYKCTNKFCRLFVFKVTWDDCVVCIGSFKVTPHQDQQSSSELSEESDGVMGETMDDGPPPPGEEPPTRPQSLPVSMATKTPNPTHNTSTQSYSVYIAYWQKNLTNLNIPQFNLLKHDFIQNKSIMLKTFL